VRVYVRVDREVRRVDCLFEDAGVVVIIRKQSRFQLSEYSLSFFEVALIEALAYLGPRVVITGKDDTSFCRPLPLEVLVRVVCAGGRVAELYVGCWWLALLACESLII